MRAYDITITQPGAKSPFRRYTSLGPNNTNDPNALDIFLDAYVYNFDAASQLPVIQIRGPSIADLDQASDFEKCSIVVKAGFQKGLPLNNPAQYGTIFTGTIFQSFGNWQGTEMTLDFVVSLAGAISEQPSNISFNWLANTPLSQSIATTLTNAFPGVKQTIQISDKLVLNHDQPGHYRSLVEFSQALQPITKAIIGASYLGVSIAMTANGLLVQDGTVQPTPTQLAFQDLIGQPTWIANRTIQFVCPMRADLSVADVVAMPKGILGNAANPYGVPGSVVTTAASQPQARQSSLFSGNFFITLVHHMGTFRQPDSGSWCTVYNAVTQ